MHKVAVIVGSLSSKSINRSLARALTALAAGRLDCTEVDLSDLPMLNGEFQNDPPPPVWRFKRDIEAADAVLIVSPEHNRSLPAVLKNAIDWGSRPWGKNSWADKPVAIIGASPGQTGTVAMQQHLRTILSPVRALAMGQPEAYIQLKPGLIDESYRVTDEGLQKVLQGFLDALVRWIDRLRAR
jgi:chromate reductase